jgi:hypothetical protein
LAQRIPFFFGNRKHIHQFYSGFFEIEDRDTTEDDEVLDEDAEVVEKGATARFYFTLTYRLAKEDVTKFNEVENMNLYLCLNTASLMKEEAEKQREEMRKMKKSNHIA